MYRLMSGSSSPPLRSAHEEPDACDIAHSRPSAASELPRIPSSISLSLQDQAAAGSEMHVARGSVSPIPRGSNPIMSKNRASFPAEAGLEVASTIYWIDFAAESANSAPGPPGPPGLRRIGPPYLLSVTATLAGSFAIATLTRLPGWEPLK